MSSAFEEALDGSATKLPVSLLMGNGFSIAFSELYAYPSLLHQINKDFHILEIDDDKFKYLDSADFEKAKRYLGVVASMTRDAVPRLGSGGDAAQVVSDMLQKDADALSSRLVDALIALPPKFDEYWPEHGRSANALTLEQIESAAKFIKRFDKVFTVNYDLLLYWVIARTDRGRTRWHLGFESPADQENPWGRWEPHVDQNVFFLHGAFHLFSSVDDDTQTSLIYVKYGERPIMSLEARIGQAVNTRGLPIIVFEGTAKEKKARIARTPYLAAAFEKLKELQGTLFVYGLSMKQDTHLLEAIAESSVERICVGHHSERPSRELKSIFESICDSRKDKGCKEPEIVYFDSRECNVWSS